MSPKLRRGALQVRLEATGTYAHPVARVLHESSHGVALVNPAPIHAFARSQFKRAKTDKVDALLIALLRPAPTVAVGTFSC